VAALRIAQQAEEDAYQSDFLSSLSVFSSREFRRLIECFSISLPHDPAWALLVHRKFVNASSFRNMRCRATFAHTLHETLLVRFNYLDLVSSVLFLGILPVFFYRNRFLIPWLLFFLLR
jgi:hypothetical protein